MIIRVMMTRWLIDILINYVSLAVVCQFTAHHLNT